MTDFDNIQRGNIASKSSEMGIDIGTGHMVAAYKSQGSALKYKVLRSCFVKVDPEMEASFTEETKFLKIDGDLFVMGAESLVIASFQNSELLRPLQQGVINPKERHSASILKQIFEYLVKTQLNDQGTIVFSIPANPIDSNNFNTYHTQTIKQLFNSWGYKAFPLTEGYAVILSETANLGQITGLGLSFGAGLVNATLAYKGSNMFSFSLQKSGDYVDEYAAGIAGENVAYIASLKEAEDFSLLKMDSNVDSVITNALIISYNFIIENTIKEINRAFSMKRCRIPEAIPVIISGGTSMPKGFIDLFKKQIKSLPFKVKDVIHSADPLNSVAKGCCLYADQKAQ